MSKYNDGDAVEFEFKGVLHEGFVEKSPFGGLTLYSDVIFLDNSGGGKFGKMFSWHINESEFKLRHKGEVYNEKVRTLSRHYIGSDPEFFFMDKDGVVSSELVLPKDGIKTVYGKVTIDGVQAEINPTADTCRELHANRIGQCLREAKDMLKEGQSISFDPLVPIKLSTLNKLSDKAKYFGCTPSFNIHDSDNKMIIDDSSKYPFRPAGGHIHLGGVGDPRYDAIFKNLQLFIPMLDIIVGNTCVLIDRHEGNIERRKCYGRAGEFRTPKHGIEYRTLSNFWLKSYPLMSFVFGLARMTMSIIHSSTEKDNFAKEIMDSVDIKDIRKAINNNDFDLALKNFSKIKPILERIMPAGETLHAGNMKQFLYFVGKVNKSGLTYWFKRDPLTYWTSDLLGGVRGNGWERFLDIEVNNDMTSITSKITKKLGL